MERKMSRTELKAYVLDAMYDLVSYVDPYGQTLGDVLIEGLGKLDLLDLGASAESILDDYYSAEWAHDPAYVMRYDTLAQLVTEYADAVRAA